MITRPVLRTLVADDEPLSRERVISLCGELPELHVVGEASDGATALELIRRLAPDLVFLDIQMPEMDGISVAEALGPQDGPALVFITAYDEYALRAFDLHAVDYLLKPFDLDRFRIAVGRAVQRRATGENRDVMDSLFRELHDRSSRYPSRLSVRNRDSIQLIRISDIDWIGSAGNYVELHIDREVHLIRQTMATMENSLDPSQFMRIHRSTIVNLERIKQISTMHKGEYQVQLIDGTRLTLSRGYRERLDSFTI